MTEKSTCSSGVQVVKVFPWLASERDSTTHGEISRLNLLDLLTELVRDGYYSRTFLDCSIRTTEGHSRHCFQFSADGKLKCLFSEEEKTETLSRDGKMQALSPRRPEDTDLLGECWTLNLCEWNQDFPGPFRKDEGVCSLSHILETGSIPRKYYLSRDASLGILNRAAKRDKELPSDLKSALLAVINQT
jgi:hypothetical protein